MAKSAAQVRQEFIDFFRSKEHAFVRSSPVVPLDDPTLLFTNAGMNQFKPYFLGTETPQHRRVANTQKCIRAGGKHNDLDDVGHDTYHHTFFEMLGNWSFGDYFKAEAIDWAWELLVTRWGLDATRLHATYFEGDQNEGLEPDLEARDLWLKLLPPERVHPGNKKDNFWEMGDTGPCGPCSEVHVDLTPDKTGASLVNAGDARVIEIWNLVFIQFNRAPGGKLSPLPARHVDTGMGFERVTAVLQGHNNNYATESFVPLIQWLEERTGHHYGGRGVTAVESAERENRYARMVQGDMRDEACRVIADHVRCLTFALTDGAVPDREGRGYVLRRILRRGVRFGWQYLNLHEPFLCELVDTVVKTMGDAFPELKQNPQRIKEIIREEEESFERTLDRGIELFNEAAEWARQDHHGEVRGEDAFKLHDTYGFPIDLTQVMAEEKGLRVDIGEYERLMEEARERARAGGKDTAHVVTVPPELVAPFGPTDDSPKYSAESLALPVQAIVRISEDGAELLGADAALEPGDEAGIVFEQTCFYAESGGQVGDSGVIGGGEVRFDVEDTQQIGETIVHLGALMTGEIVPGQQVTLTVDPARRATMKNHTATHILNWALRAVLGDHVQQKGSLVDAEKTRFDFSHPKALSPEEIEQVERLVNEQVERDLEVHYELVPQEEALKISGLRAVFGERYPDVVRVMSVGVPVSELVSNPDCPDWCQHSIEFCGGTHLERTGQIEHFVLIAEEAVAKGIRRVVGITGPLARQAEELGAALVERASRLQDGPAEELAAGLTELQDALAAATVPVRQRIALRELLSELQKRAKQQQKASAAGAADAVREHVDELLQQAAQVGETTVAVGELPELSVDQLKTAADMVKQKCGSAAVLFGVRAGEKALLLAAMTDDLVKRGLKAGDLIKQVAKLVKGGGGGPPTMAQAGGKDAAGVPAALEAGREWIEGKLG